MFLKSDQSLNSFGELHRGKETTTIHLNYNHNLALSEMRCWATGYGDVMLDWFMVLKINALLPLRTCVI